MLVLHLSDVHVTDPVSPLARFANGEERLRMVIDHLLENPVPLDAVVLTGDLVDRGSAEEYERLLPQLRRLRCAWFPLPGNHDDRAELRRVLGPHVPAAWSDDGPCNYCLDLTTAAGEQVRLVLVDSSQPGFHSGRWSDVTLDWLGTTLAAAPQRRTLVFTHHPPVSTGLWHMDYGGAAGGEALEQIIASHPQVALVACGHVHRRLVMPWAGTILAAAPSLTFLTEALLGDHDPVLHSGLPELPVYRVVDGRLLIDSLDWQPDRARLPMRMAFGDLWDDYVTAARSGVVPSDLGGH